MFKKMFISIFITFLLINIPITYCATEEGYGEGNDNLGQFTDTFINETFVMVKDTVIRNSTLNCMELEYSALSVLSGDVFQLREHDNYASYEPNWAYSIDSSESVEAYETTVALGMSYMFMVIDSSFLDGKYIRIRWKWDSNYELFRTSYFRVMDGTYNRANDTHFPDDAGIITFGSGLMYSYREISAYRTWLTRDFLIDISTWGGTEDNTTIAVLTTDGDNRYTSYSYIDWIEINGGSGGSDNLFTIDFDATTNLVMEVTGTDGDYGYVNNTGLPFSSGGYLEDGYFITKDYLNYTLGESLVLMTNATIPTGTDMTVQFSNDNVTWVNNLNANGYNSITDGFLSIDLRNLNYSDQFILYNMSGTDSETPRLYQSRLVTTNGTGGNGVTTYLEDYAGLLIVGLILGLVLGIGTSRS